MAEMMPLNTEKARLENRLNAHFAVILKMFFF